MLDSDLVRTTFLVIATLGQAVFVLLYVALPWYKSHLGRALFFKASAMLALLALGTLGRVTGNPAPDAIFTMLYATMAIGIWWQVTAFVRVFLGKEEIDHE